jgi:hypothetical protein
MSAGDIWDWITEKFSDGWEAIGDMFSNMFSNMGELSYAGLVGGVLCAGIILVFKHQMFDPFHASIITFVITLVLAFVLGYLTVRGIWESG